MYDFLLWLEGSSLGHAMRNSGVWTYGLVNLTHILGVSALFGSVLVLDLRLLGAWRDVALVSVSGTTLPIARAGFVVAVISGIGLLATKATEYVGNPFLLIKFPAIAIALINVAVIERLPAWKARAVREATDGERRQLAIAGIVSLVSWLTAVSAGRMIGYW
ncbi:MAG TPA: DUF6644 family protein [Vicinamibacterales bacterium]|nr:DUF6644 family protein [Vicinamibacterales bacterium]